MGEKPPHFKFFNEHLKYKKLMRPFAEMAVVANHDKKKTRTKIEERGRTVMFVGYADDHTGDVYRFIHTLNGTRCEMAKYNCVECIYEKAKKIESESGRK